MGVRESTIILIFPMLTRYSTEQFLKIPNYIIDKYPFYDLYLDLHTTITDDAVLYAIPKKS